MYKYSSTRTLRTRTTHTRKIMHYERGLHMYTLCVMYDLTSVCGVLVRNA